jgi:hypothetical protein
MSRSERFSAEVGTELNGMALVRQIASPSRAHWDGTRILFEITDGNEQISCAISQGALEEIGEKRCFSRAADLLECFANARGRIERLALEKLKAGADGISGRLSLWADDVDFVPPNGTPVAGQLFRHRGA